MTFNRQRNERIRNISLSGILLSFILLYPSIPVPKNLLTLFLPLIPLGLLVFIPFRQLLEPMGDSAFQTCFQVDQFRFNRHVYPKEEIRQILLVQDHQRYFCLTIQFKNLPDLVIERHATSGIAERRLAELRETIG